MLPKGYTIRKMTRKELDTAVEWTAKEGWNPGLHDADVFWACDQKGFVALEKDGKLVGSGSIVSYDGKFGFMGFFIVKPEFRSKGLGTELWKYRRDTLVNRLDKGAAIGMDGVFAMQGFYAKGGFKFAHRDLRFESVAKKETYSANVSKIVKKDFAEIYEFDKKYFGFERTRFLQGWFNMPESLSVKYMDGGKVMAYGTVRKCRSGYKIGPLFAENYKVALDVFKALAGFAKGEKLYLDAPEVNKDAMKLAKKYGMKEMFGCARMYLGKAPKLPYGKIYGVTSFELG